MAVAVTTKVLTVEPEFPKDALRVPSTAPDVVLILNPAGRFPSSA